MRFLAVPTADALGHILGHNITDDSGRRVFRKGKALSAEDIARLHTLGRTTVYVAQLEPDDIDEDSAARRIARAVAGVGLTLSQGATGRVNLHADVLGLVRVAVDRLVQLNTLPGVTLATLPGATAVQPGRMVGTLKIIPYAVPAATVAQAERVAAGSAPLLCVAALPPRRVGLILSGTPAARPRIVSSFENALRPRLEALNARLVRTDFVPLEDEAGEFALARTVADHVAAGVELVILAGETAIQDRYDIAPRAVERAGGEVTCFGAPVDPGNLLMLGYHGAVPIVGAPGCARSPKHNIIDLVLPRVLAGDRLTVADVISWGHGGLLEDVPERPLPRSRLT